MVLNPLPDVINKKLKKLKKIKNKNSACLVASYECLLSKSTGNRLQKIPVLRELRQEIVPYLLVKVYKGHNGYELIHSEWTDTLKCFRLCHCSLVPLC